MNNMTMKIAQTALLLAASLLAGASQAHVTLETPRTTPGSAYKAVLRVGHACEGAQNTRALWVRLPEGFRGAKPMPKPGWRITLTRRPLTQPYDNHGKPVVEEVREIRWEVIDPAQALPGDFYDEFVLRGSAPSLPGPAWFKVLQVCDKGEVDWAETPAEGSSLKDLSAPAALLEVLPASDAHAEHH